MRTWILLVGAAMGMATTLCAQTDSSASTGLDEVIITANRLPQKQSQTGKVVSVITRDQISKSTGKTVSQLLNEQAGITIAGAMNNAGSPQTLFMRGANAGRTLVLVDGIPVYDPSLINNEYDLNLLNINDVERIEICRGAQSTLYGSDAIAGVINIITLKTDVQKPVNVKATASLGSLNTFRGNLQVYGKKNKLSYMARYARLSTRGFSAAFDSAGNQGFDNDAYAGNNLNASLRYDPSEKWTIKTFVQHNDYTNDVDASAFADEKDFTIENKNRMAGTGFQYKGNGFTVTGNYVYSDLDRRYINDSLDKPGFVSYSTDQYFGRNQFLELYTNINLGKGFTALYGTDYRFSSMNNQYFSLSMFGPYASAFRDTSVSQASMYGSLLYNRGKLNVELGGRLNVHARYGSNATYTFNPSYSLSNRLRVFGSIATGFKAPSLYQMYSSAGNRELNAEESINYEFGAQYSHKAASIRMVYFYRDIDNGIDYNNNTFRYFNIVKQKVSGLETEANIQLTKKLRLTANYTWLNADEEAQSRVTAKDSSYNYLLRRPEHSINATLGYQVMEKWYTSVQVRYAGKRYDAGGYRKSDVMLDPYLVLGAYTEYTIKPWIKTFADFQNITNQQFFDIRGYNSIPFMMNAGITVHW